MPGEASQTREILTRLKESAPKDNPRLQSLVAALGEAMDGDDRRREEAEKMLKEYEEAYEKLTAPANRVGVYVAALADDLHLVAVGEQEFVVQRDPKIDVEGLHAGARVKVNEGYAIVGVAPATMVGGLVKIGEALEDGRLRLGGNGPGEQGGGRLVMRGEGLKDTVIRAGDEVRLDPSGRFAIEHFFKNEGQDYFLEAVPEIGWDQVGGQTEAISLIRETIETPLLYPEIFESFGKKPIKGILLYGPPGCGKTLIGKATAHNLTEEYKRRTGKDVKEYFMSISGPKILNMWLGETERMVREIFSTAREKAKEGRLVFIFMDEAESILRTRSGGRYLNISNTVVPQFCAELDGLQTLDNVVLMLTSNRPDYIDPAVLRPGRIDRKVKINRPDRPSTEQIVGIYVDERLPLDAELLAKHDGERECARKELVAGLTEYLWRKSRETEFLKVFHRDGSSHTLYWKDMVSGAIIENIIDRAKDTAIRRAIEAKHGKAGLTMLDLTSAADREYKENEIFPKSDALEDWLQLLDVEPENVVSVRPIGRHRGEEIARKGIL